MDILYDYGYFFVSFIYKIIIIDIKCVLIFTSEAVINSELIEESKLSILNKDDEDIKSNGYISF